MSTENTCLPRLEIGCYRLHFQPASAIPEGRYTGSAWRGIFGHALRRLACTMRDVSCPECMLYHTCVYSYLFETPPPPGAAKMRKYVAAPHPFVLAPGETPHGDDYVLGLSLFGRANRMLAYVVRAFQQAARRGMWPLEKPFELTDVEQQTEAGAGEWTSILDGEGRLTPLAPKLPACPPPPSRVRVVMLTPLRLRIQEAYVRADQFRFVHLFSNLLRRFSLLTYFHCDEPFETDFAALIRQAERVPLARAELRWHDLTRYSSRQKERLQIGGLLGVFELDAAALGSLWPYLWLGQFTHAGKGATMGLGRYVVLPD